LLLSVLFFSGEGPFHTKWRPIPYDSRSQTRSLHWLDGAFHTWSWSNKWSYDTNFGRIILRLGPDQRFDQFSRATTWLNAVVWLSSHYTTNFIWLHALQNFFVCFAAIRQLTRGLE